MIISYEKALAKAQKILCAKNNLAKYCRENHISYVAVLSIKNGKIYRENEKYPKLVQKILESQGFDVQLEKTFNYILEKGKKGNA